jgi:hypothetical protein
MEGGKDQKNAAAKGNDRLLTFELSRQFIRSSAQRSFAFPRACATFFLPSTYNLCKIHCTLARLVHIRTPQEGLCE